MNMIKNVFRLLFVLLVIITMNSCQNKSNGDTTKIKIEFDGFKDDYHDKYNMWLTIEDQNVISELSQLIEQTTKSIRCADIRPVMWKINLHAHYENKKENHILTLTSSTHYKESLNKGRSGCYEEVELVNKLKKLVRIDEIKGYEGKMRQKQYDKILENKN